MSSQHATRQRHVVSADGTNAAIPATEDGPLPVEAWEKVLWKRQPFPDNHVPPSFLQDLQHLPSRPRPTLDSLFFVALPITQHLAVIALFIAVFYGLLIGSLEASEVGWTCVGLGLLGHWIRRWGWAVDVDEPHPANSDRILPSPTVVRPLILPPLLLSLLAPVLGTLTSATTSDSIWPLAGGLFFVHLLLADFKTGRDARQRRRERLKREERRRRNRMSHVEVDIVEEKSLTSSLSFTSALCASVVLASRLPSTAHVFSLVLLSVGLFAGWPVIAKGVREAGRVFSITLTGSMILLAVSFFPRSTLYMHPPKGEVALIGLSGPLLIFLLVIILVNVVGPGMLWYGWRWKTRRRGGWDVAVVRLRRPKKDN